MRKCALLTTNTALNVGARGFVHCPLPTKRHRPRPCTEATATENAWLEAFAALSITSPRRSTARGVNQKRFYRRKIDGGRSFWSQEPLEYDEGDKKWLNDPKTGLKDFLTDLESPPTNKPVYRKPAYIVEKKLDKVYEDHDVHLWKPKPGGFWDQFHEDLTKILEPEPPSSNVKWEKRSGLGPKELIAMFHDSISDIQNPLSAILSRRRDLMERHDLGPSDFPTVTMVRLVSRCLQEDDYAAALKVVLNDYPVCEADQLLVDALAELPTFTSNHALFGLVRTALKNDMKGIAITLLYEKGYGKEQKMLLERALLENKIEKHGLSPEIPSEALSNPITQLAVVKHLTRNGRVDDAMAYVLARAQYLDYMSVRVVIQAGIRQVEQTRDSHDWIFLDPSKRSKTQAERRDELLSWFGMVVETGKITVTAAELKAALSAVRLRGHIKYFQKLLANPASGFPWDEDCVNTLLDTATKAAAWGEGVEIAICAHKLGLPASSGTLGRFMAHVVQAFYPDASNKYSPHLKTLFTFPDVSTVFDATRACLEHLRNSHKERGWLVPVAQLRILFDPNVWKDPLKDNPKLPDRVEDVLLDELVHRNAKNALRFMSMDSIETGFKMKLVQRHLDRRFERLASFTPKSPANVHLEAGGINDEVVRPLEERPLMPISFYTDVVALIKSKHERWEESLDSIMTLLLTEPTPASAFEFLRQLHEKSINPRKFTLGKLLRTLIEKGHIELAWRLLEKLTPDLNLANGYVFEEFISASGYRYPRFAMLATRTMEQRGLIPRRDTLVDLTCNLAHSPRLSISQAVKRVTEVIHMLRRHGYSIPKRTAAALLRVAVLRHGVSGSIERQRWAIMRAGQWAGPKVAIRVKRMMVKWVRDYNLGLQPPQ
ncbi:hypothetical protein SAICODRAFT_180640 [Saitoella complicata NRRL Y-17804]|uniref:Pentatricopeptide repeat domain-containing protein n=1 Tax=Saitoella complicata (strain BCRC 22490 / CBS 7301 / JCM 7358 / NBRC 10748 / NRRL Y-17804) TaxID=698492 RepID=A0A0E9NIT7_SAICN|nr:uncharacterized protein SAICODRAFT_180640 [Saitoella complicata NRRL Y-17804]ODQ50033.1 hypothetical protein SAICODRAFT_180640 [Saitoella complicata NRRL Y-17804]GAO49723.1 hypothetical protein G7K_3866-t1 [Saitoella complicata NRRL Y-17804]